MKSKLLVYSLPLVLFSLLIYGYNIMDQNPDYNTNAPFVKIEPNTQFDFSTTATWTTMPVSPHAQSRSTCAYIMRNDTGYVYQFGGGSGALLRNVARFNLATNSWTNNVSTMPQDISAGGTAVYGDSVIFVFGGQSSTAGSIIGRTLKYNIVTNTWTEMALIPSGVTDALVAKYRDTLIYVVGGGDGLFGATTLQRNTVQIYNIKSNTYSSGGTLPIPLSMMGGGIYKDTIMVFSGATTGGTYVANSYKGVINPATLQVTWTPIANYPTGNVTRMASYVCTIPGEGVGIACTGGAIAGSTLTAATNFWNMCTQSWQTLPNNSLARSNFRGTGAGNNIMYVVGGFTTTGVGNFERLTFTQIDGDCSSPPPPGSCIVAGQWAPSGTFPAVTGGSYFGSSAWLGDTLYAQNTVGGVAATQVVRYTWNGSWTTGVPLPGPKTGMALVAAGGKLYGVAGATSSLNLGPFSDELLSYNPSTGAWTTLAPMPVSMSGHSAVVWGDSVIFVVGGPYTGSGTNLAVHYYRIASNTWGTISNSLPSGQGRRTFGLGIVGNKIIMSAGFNTAFLKSTYVGTIGSNASSITWAAAPDVPVPSFFTGLSRPGATTYDDFFFLVNGERGPSGGYHDTTHVFSVTQNQWVGMITDIPYKRSNIFNNVTARCINDTASIFIPGGYGSVTGGTPGVGTNLFDVTRVGLLTGITPVSSEIPGTYELSQNYPNPFNPVTKINFSIPKNGFVTLKIYDILGKEVATLVNEIRNAGSHSIDFNASALSSGAYFYRIEAGDFKAVKKMMLIK